jgi:hypothetical protein
VAASAGEDDSIMTGALGDGDEAVAKKSAKKSATRAKTRSKSANDRSTKKSMKAGAGAGGAEDDSTIMFA